MPQDQGGSPPQTITQTITQTCAASHLLADPNGDVPHFDLPTLPDPQTLALDVLDPDVNTWSSE